MSDAYDKMLKRADLRRKRQETNVKRHRVLDDSFSQDADAPNIFVQTRQQSLQQRVQRTDKQKSKSPNQHQKAKQKAQGEFQDEQQYKKQQSNQISAIPNKISRLKHQSDIQIVDDQDIQQGRVQQEKAPLNLFQSLKYFLGLHTTHISYPRKQTIYIDCNNPSNPEIKSPLKNDISVNSAYVTLFIFLKQTLFRIYIWVWLAIVIVEFTFNGLFSSFGFNISPSILLGLLVACLIINGIIQHLLVRNRRVSNLQDGVFQSRGDQSFGEQTQKYKVYHHYGESAEWIPTQSTDLHAGQLFKVPPGKYFPCDCLLLHSKHSMVPVEIDRIFSTLTHHPKITIKQTVIKADIMLLPIAGQLETQQTSTEIMSFSADLFLTSPVQSKYPNVNMSNLALRGYKNVSEESEVLCLAVSTGVQNFSLRQAQYPMVRSIDKQMRLSDLADRLILITVFAYLVIVGLTILFHYINIQARVTPYYFRNAVLKNQTWKVLIHLLANYIIFLPIFLRTSVLIFVFIQGLVIQKACKINESIYTEIKDFNCLQKLPEIDTIVTSIDCLRNSQGFTMHSFKVKEIHHVFQRRVNSTIFESQSHAYGIEDIDLIKYFMSVALLTTHNQDYEQEVSGFEKAIRLSAKECGVRMEWNRVDKCTIVNNQQFRVRRMLKVPMTYHRPYIMYFYKPVRKNHEEEQDDRVLCLIRGNPELILQKVYGKEVQMSKWSKKMHEQKGYYIQLIGKITLKLSDVDQIEAAYRSGSMQLSVLNQGLQRYLSRVESMGLLIFNNEFSSNKLESRLLNIPVDNPQSFHKYSQQKQRNMIILTPPSDSLEQPQFQSIHTLTNLLQQAFGFNLNQISGKLIHDQIITSQSLLRKLQQQKILVLNGWTKRDVIDMMNQLAEPRENSTGNTSVKTENQQGQLEPIRLMGYFEKDEYLFIARNCEICITKNGFDLEKYSDIVLKDNGKYDEESKSKNRIKYEKNTNKYDQSINQFDQRKQQSGHTSVNITPLVLKRLFSYDTPILSSNLKQIITNQFTKSIILIAVEVVASFYTWGSGMLLISGSQFLLLEIIMLADVLYYLNFSHQKLPPPKETSFAGALAIESSISLIEACFISFVTIYSLQSIPNGAGTVKGFEFTSVLVYFGVINLLILRKLFTTAVISLYKILLIVIQLIIYYVGMIIIAQVDSNTSAAAPSLKQIFWYMFQGRMLITGFGVVGVCLAIEMVKVVVRAVFMKGYSNYYKKLKEEENKRNSKRAISKNYEVKLETLD